MTYSSQEKSQQGGVPVEFYEFWQGTTFYRYTTSSRDETFLGESYTAIPISRTGPETSKESRKADLQITVPVDTEAISQFKTYYPDDPMNVRIRRAHRDSNGDPDAAAYITFWIGRIKLVEFGQENATITCDPLEAAIDNMILRYHYQRQCNHNLYGIHCQVDRAAFTTTVAVVSVVGSVYTVTGDDFADKQTAAWPNGSADWWIAGEAIINGARRMITATSASPPTLSLTSPIQGIGPGSILTIYAGCDKSITTCKEKFNNAVNNGSFPYVPGANLFEIGLPKVTS